MECFKSVHEWETSLFSQFWQEYNKIVQTIIIRKTKHLNRRVNVFPMLTMTFTLKFRYNCLKQVCKYNMKFIHRGLNRPLLTKDKRMNKRIIYLYLHLYIHNQQPHVLARGPTLTSSLILPHPFELSKIWK